MPVDGKVQERIKAPSPPHQKEGRTVKIISVGKSAPIDNSPFQDW